MFHHLKRCVLYLLTAVYTQIQTLLLLFLIIDLFVFYLLFNFLATTTFRTYC